MPDADRIRWKGWKVLPSWRDLLVFDLFLFSLLILATRLATFLHEYLGHALMTLVFGGQVQGIRISLLGGGKVFWHFAGPLSQAGGFLVAFGGILVNFLTGLGLLKWAGALKMDGGRALFASLLSMVSLLGALAYTSLGFYYDVGDPVAWMEGPDPGGGLLWLPFVLASPLMSFIVVRSFGTLVHRYFPVETFPARTALMLLTLGVAVGAYAGLYGLTRQRSAAVDTPLVAFQRAERGVLEEKREHLFRSLRQARPELTEDEIWEMVNRAPIRVAPEEVPRRFPLKPVLGLLYALGGLFALVRMKGAATGTRATTDPVSVLLSVLLAAGVMAYLTLTGGWLYGAA